MKFTPMTKLTFKAFERLPQKDKETEFNHLQKTLQWQYNVINELVDRINEAEREKMTDVLILRKGHTITKDE